MDRLIAKKPSLRKRAHCENQIASIVADNHDGCIGLRGFVMARWTRWIGLGVIAVGLVGGDQIRLNRPDHKYRLTVEIETPQGKASASGVFAVHPNRGYTGTGSAGTRTRGDALVIDAGDGKGLVVLLAQEGRPLDIDGMNYIDMRALNDGTGRRVQFRELKTIKETVPVKGALVPVMLAFADMKVPSSARLVKPGELDAALAPGVKLRRVSVEPLPPGWWPIDFGGALGEPVTREIGRKLPWWDSASASAATAVKAADLELPEGTTALDLFRR